MGCFESRPKKNYLETDLNVVSSIFVKKDNKENIA